ncbi:MAG: transcriptional regulator GcvA [Oceanospirillaceae bacterium]|jgi:LysR family glycine cleavage system transcriptional activator|nr:transcriptional regulator GcvA [Oceanospirillaceae bacterium]MBT4443843.1 transcriptional regulator GcvA [Oceanospirillaceae bacterium]MBT6076938.1 transcriptional regulator GcvA [Oceanospirillaceae bacterium]
MARKLPPLNSLRAFEAAARHLSFTRAADELCVTQAAISHQVKGLEDYLGHQLFERLPRNLTLTSQGAALMPVLADVFDDMANAVASLKQEKVGSLLNVRLAPSFAAKWLSPRLKQFWQLYPEIHLCLFHAHNAVDFEREDIDLAVTYGRGDWKGVESTAIVTLDFFPVASPTWLANNGPISEPEQLLNATLLHDADPYCWNEWLRQADVKGINNKRGTTIDDTNVLIQAAIDSQGVALGSTPFVEDHLAAGRLVRLFDQVLITDYAYYVVCPKTHLQRPDVRALKEWLLAQV